MEELKSSNRRIFLKQLATFSALATLSPLDSIARNSFHHNKDIKITILHSNDVHSRIEPFPMDGSKMQGLGGVARRSTLIQKIRSEEQHVLLFDAGDMFQGTPYFNLFEGQVELELMSKLRYDAGTFGNHEFDNGLNGILKHFDKASFPFITSNYDFSETVLAGKTKEYLIFERGGVKIGVFALGVDVEGLVDPNGYKGMKYLDPMDVTGKLVPKLKNDLKCDFVICLSHMGYSYKDDRISDLKLAANSRDIDLIIGGHTHTFLEKPTEVKNLDGKITLVNQVGFGGASFGRIDFIFNSGSKRKEMLLSSNYTIDSNLEKSLI